MIPKILHQVWIGTTIPAQVKTFMDTWKAMCLAYGWEYKLWDNQAIANFPLVNKKEFNEAATVTMQSNIVRAEVINAYGGVYCDCDVEWLEQDPALFIPLDSPWPVLTPSTMWVDDSKVKWKLPPFNLGFQAVHFSGSMFAAPANSKLFTRVVTEIPNSVVNNKGAASWFLTGGSFYTNCWEGPVVIVPNTLWYSGHHLSKCWAGWRTLVDPIEEAKVPQVIGTDRLVLT